MVLYLFITAVVLFMGYFVNTEYRKSNRGVVKTAALCRQEMINKTLVFAVFFVLFALSALRIGIGNDYWEYRDQFLYIAGWEKTVSFEAGFQYSVRLMQWLFGKDNYRTSFALFAFLTCGFAIKGIYDNAEWFFYSLFLFMANGFYFMSFSNVRYYFVFAVVIYAMKYLFERRFVPFILWICVAALFHKTVLVVIPIFLVAYFLKWTKKTVWMIPVASAVLFFGSKPIRWLVFKFYPYYEGDALYDTGRVSYMNILKCAAVLVLCLIFYKKAIKGNEKAETLFNLNLFALLLYSFCSYIPELTRICYYMVLGHIFLIPMVLLSIEDKKKRYLWTGIVSVAYIGYYLVFLYQGYNPYIMFLPYMTWLFT
ncbi:MAG: EpsG family protein [Lachnospiraceae bacterium]|nr:EpsG family protein [Lachnospiraceae bacterium]